MNQRNRTRLTVFLLGAMLVLASLVGAGCSGYNDDRGIGDAPADQQSDQAVKVWPMPDQFANVAALCIGPNGVYATTREAPVMVVQDDANCAENGVLRLDQTEADKDS